MTIATHIETTLANLTADGVAVEPGQYVHARHLMYPHDQTIIIRVDDNGLTATHAFTGLHLPLSECYYDLGKLKHLQWGIK